MRYLISFDDTDNLQTLGTGHALARFCGGLPCTYGFITRHQLFVDAGVPYTSHNSAMCVEIDTDLPLAEIAESAARFLEAESAEGSDPGLCVAQPDLLPDVSPLVEWGRRAKSEILAKPDAYALAERCGVHLSEHGGDGQGVVGALAAVGLRLSGNDGRVRGKAPVEGETATVRGLLDASGFEQACDLDGNVLGDDVQVSLAGGMFKAIFRDRKSTIPVAGGPGCYRTLGKDEVKGLGY